MGGRGSSSGVRNRNRTYGTEYKSLHTDGNIKFVAKKYGNPTAPMETMTKGRVYVTLDKDGKPKYISYYDKENMRVKQIDLDKPHRGVTPHTHHGYEHNERDSDKGFSNLTEEERAIVDHIMNIWKQTVYGKWRAEYG